MPQGRHWTAESADAFVHKLAFDFIAQVEKRMEVLSLSQVAVAHRLGISEGAVSHVLNNPQNLTLKTIAKYSRALGIKAAIVAYDDGDPENHNGLIASEVFSTCWERRGSPRDMWSLRVSQPKQAATTITAYVASMTVPMTFAGNNSDWPLRGSTFTHSFIDLSHMTHQLTAGLSERKIVYAGN